MKKFFISVLIAILAVLCAVTVMQAQDETPVEPTAVVTEAASDSTEAPEVTATPEAVMDDEVSETAEPTEEEPEPTADPKEEPVEEPSEEPAEEPVDENPTGEPTDDPTEEPTEEPELVAEETEEPAEEVTETPAPEEPEHQAQPEDDPTKQPEVTPENEKANDPVEDPTEEPTEEPVPTEEPTEEPAAEPEEEPEEEPKHGRVIVTITGTQLSVSYNGSEQSASGYTVESISDPEYKADYIAFNGGDLAAVRTDVGTTEMGLNALMFSNTNEEFENVMFVVTDGFIEVTPLKVDVEIIGAVTKTEYDGEFHMADGYSFRQLQPEGLQIYSEDYFEMKDGFTANVGEVEIGQYWMGLNESAFENTNPNFDVTFHVTDGYLVITEPLSVDTTGEEPAEDPVDEEPVEEPVDEEPVEDPVDGEPVEEPTGEEPVEDPVDGEPVEEPTDETVIDPVIVDEDEEFEGAVASDDEAVEEPAEETKGEEETMVVTAGTVICDENGNELYTVDSDIELVILHTTDGRIAIHLEDGSMGYIFVPEEDEEEVPEEETVTLTISANTNIRLSADGMSEIIHTLEEDTELTILEIGEEWVTVQLADGTIGYIHRSDIFPAEPVEPAEPAEPAEQEAAPQPATPKKVTIFTSRRSQMELGETIVLTSLLEGFDDCTSIKYQWECDKGSGFEKVEGADGDSYSYPATVETLGWNWRLVVYYR